MSEADLIRLSGVASAHSHAFQRALRGHTHARRGDFFSWRELMYRVAANVGPDALYDLSHYAFAELAQAGVTAVGEFHYLHHQPDGAPYADRLELSDAVVRAARDAGLRITLLRVLYHRAGAGRPPEGAQRRFCDARVEDALEDLEALSARFADDRCVRVGVALHSVRACPIEWFEAVREAVPSDMPLHAHVSEVRREVDECLAEHGRRPVQLLAERGMLGPRFTAVHATHLDEGEVRALGEARAMVCLCRTTERDLGDGTPPTPELLTAGARLCFGVDSHAISDPFVEARAAELDARVRAEQRALIDPSVLAHALGEGGYEALGVGERWGDDEVVLDGRAPAMVGAKGDAAVVFAATAACVREVTVAGVPIVVDHEHIGLRAARVAFERRLIELL